jgi:hypothetical protein
MDQQVVSVQERAVASTIMLWSDHQRNSRFKVSFNGGIFYCYIPLLYNKHNRSHLLNQCVGACH